MSSPRLRIIETRVMVRNAFTRLPFRFGVVTMEAAATGFLEVQVEFADGSRATGVAADMLAYKWFDKNPDKSPADNVADLLQALRDARRIYAELPAGTPFELWSRSYQDIEKQALSRGFNRLIASFAASMMERAIIDAVGRHLGATFDQMTRDNLFGMQPEQVVSTVSHDHILASLPLAPLAQIDLRHTVGLIDPLRRTDVGPDAPQDGLPVSLEDYLETDQLRYLKIKVGGDDDADIARLKSIASIMAASGRQIRVTLDGNEQYQSLESFVSLVENIRSTPALAQLWDAVLFIEQPLHRDVAMAEKLSPAAKAAIDRPLLIDEADGWTEAYLEAIELGYEGVSHKNCKGVYRSLINKGLAHNRNQAAPGAHYFQSAEDLTNLATVPLQADLAVVATLGISHVERNGHHYFAGLAHLPEKERQAALATHADLYEDNNGIGALRISNGQLNVASLQVPGLGVSDLPDLSQAVPEADWRFEMLENRP